MSNDWRDGSNDWNDDEFADLEHKHRGTPLDEAIRHLETVLNETPLDTASKRHITQAFLLMQEIRQGTWSVEELGIHE